MMRRAGADLPGVVAGVVAPDVAFFGAGCRHFIVAVAYLLYRQVGRRRIV